jgi:hypothetical protein
LDRGSGEYRGIEKYLIDKNFIKRQDNINSSITVSGIDEVEEGFPTLGGKTDDSKEKKLLQLHDRLSGLEDLRKQGLLTFDERDSAKKQAINVLDYVLTEDSILRRKFLKSRQGTDFTKVEYGQFAGKNDKKLEPLLEFTKKALEEFDVDASQRDIHLSAGMVYKARKIIRNILSSAQTSIDIQDNWLNVDILPMIEPYLEMNKQLSIRLLTKDVKPGLLSDLALLEEQYKHIPLKTNSQCHDRYIIIDKRSVFDTGGSLKDLGRTASTVKHIENQKAIDDIIADFESWWKTGQSKN